MTPAHRHPSRSAGRLLAILRSCFDRRLSTMAVAVVVLQSVGIAFELILPIMYGRLIDGGLLSGDASHALAIGLVMTLAVAAQALTAYGAVRLIARVVISVGTALRRRLIATVVTGDTDLTDIEAGGMVTRTTRDVMQVQALVSTAFGSWFLSVAITVFGMSTLFVIVPMAAPFALVILVAYIGLGVALIRRLGPGMVRIMAFKDRVNTTYADRIRGRQTLRAMPPVTAVVDPFTGTNRALRDIEVNLGKTMAKAAPATTLITAAGAIAIVSTGAVSVHAGSMQIGQLSAAITIFLQVIFGLTLLLLSALSLPMNLASVNRIHDVLGAAADDAPVGERPLGPGPDRSLLVENVTVTDHVSGRRVLDVPTLHIQTGRRIGVTGPMGAGKSLLVRTIAGLVSPGTGRVSVLPADPDRPVTPLAICGYQGQDPYLTTGTIRSNLYRPDAPEPTAESVTAALRLAAIDELVRRRGLDTPVNFGGAEFSVGERQRLALAVAFLQSRGLVVLDDPVSAVDPATRGRIIDELFTADYGIVVIATTDPDILTRCDDVVFLDNGALIDVLPHHTLFDRYRDYRLLVGDHDCEGAAQR